LRDFQTISYVNFDTSSTLSCSVNCVHLSPFFLETYKRLAADTVHNVNSKSVSPLVQFFFVPEKSSCFGESKLVLKDASPA